MGTRVPLALRASLRRVVDVKEPRKVLHGAGGSEPKCRTRTYSAADSARVPLFALLFYEVAPDLSENRERTRGAPVGVLTSDLKVAP